ncbi:hypothetical protein [Pseudomonas promysalinigenes]|uniref:Uncharacterized protein n=1 Tax=Pseudomonas promysalinigenes TaxID=485898 RepID=A0ABY6AS71_9PSED|nr:hypothetical protein [Pseudomonas promysalinigenes]UXH41598.1 hypothetical protein N5C08_08770 [Pseudomonas promysalinigenes]
MNIVREMYRNACRQFEAQIEECAKRALGCPLAEGLEHGRVAIHAGKVFVDGKQICYTEPPRITGWYVTWVFQDLTAQEKH